MGVLTSEVGYTSATAMRGDHESSYEHVVALGGRDFYNRSSCIIHETEKRTLNKSSSKEHLLHVTKSVTSM